MKVAIIGAGVAGLALANELHKRGAQAEVFEKSRGLGGRLSNKRFDWGHIDIGAQYFTAHDPRFQKQLAQWQQSNTIALWPFTPHVISESGLAASPDDTARYVGTPSMNSLAHALADDAQRHGVDIHLNTHIHALQRQDDQWTLATNSNETFGFYDWAVLSLPAEQSGDLLNNLDIAEHIPRTVHTPCWALALATRGEVASEIQGIFGDDVVSWVSRLSARPQRLKIKDYDDLWMLHFSSEWSAAHGKDTQVNIAGTGLQWLTSAIGKHASKPLELVHSYAHYWRYARLNSDALASPIVIDKSKQVAAIGAWAAGGKVEGAYLSALDLIDHMF